jgi:hypothetical protein
MRKVLSHHEFIEHLYDVTIIPGKVSSRERRTLRDKQCASFVTLVDGIFKSNARSESLVLASCGTRLLFLDGLILENESDVLSRNVGNLIQT